MHKNVIITISRKSDRCGKHIGDRLARSRCRPRYDPVVLEGIAQTLGVSGPFFRAEDCGAKGP